MIIMTAMYFGFKVSMADIFTTLVMIDKLTGPM
jgi:hypothetical protein